MRLALGLAVLMACEGGRAGLDDASGEPDGPVTGDAARSDGGALASPDAAALDDAAPAAPDAAGSGPGGWISQPIDPSYVLRDVWFTDAAHGWIIGATHVLRTTDGGASWIPQDLGLGSGEIYTDVEFVDAQHGWITCLSGLLSTSDGGDTWTLTAPNGAGGDVLAMSFVSPLIGWVVTPSSVRKTTNGGASWSTQLSNGYAGIDFAIATNGWVTRSDGIFHTEHGGASWEKQWTSPAGAELGAVLAVGPATAWVVGTTDEDSGIGELKLVTRDGGASWDAAPATSNNTGLHDIAFADELEGWAVGHGGSIIHTDDGGVTWSVQQAAVVNEPDLWSVFFVDASTGWAVGAGTILKTTTGGE